MLKRKIILQLIVVALCIFCFANNAFSQKIDTISVESRQKIDSLSNIILSAHRTFMKLSAEVKKQADTKSEKKFAANTDSIFKARRGVINALLNNFYLLPEEQKKIANQDFQSYIIGAENANSIVPQANKAKKAIAFSYTMASSNKKVLKDLKFVAPATGTNASFEIKPNNVLTMNIKFPTNANKSNYVFYIFPVIWCGDPDKLGSCYDNNRWGDLKNCNKIGFAKEWTNSKGTKVNALYSGNYTILIYNKVQNKVINKDEIILPLDKTYTYIFD